MPIFGSSNDRAQFSTICFALPFPIGNYQFTPLSFHQNSLFFLPFQLGHQLYRQGNRQAGFALPENFSYVFFFLFSVHIVSPSLRPSPALRASSPEMGKEEERKFIFKYEFKYIPVNLTSFYALGKLRGNNLDSRLRGNDRIREKLYHRTIRANCPVAGSNV